MTKMGTKDFHAAVKAAGKDDGLGDGQVKMVVSVFGNVDSHGDIVMPGAFTDTLKAWKASGDPIPFIWSHQWGDPFSHVGAVTEAKETAQGLEVTAQLDLSFAKGKQVFALLKGRRVTQASFGYTIDDAEWVEKTAEDGAKYEVFELRKLSLIECGPCLVGANQETELLAAKAAELRGRALPAETLPHLKAMRDSIDGAIATAEAVAHKTSGDEPDATDNPSADQTDTSGQPDDREANDSPDDGQGEESSAQSPSSKSAQVRARLLLTSIPTEGD